MGLAVALSGCDAGESHATYEWKLPAGFPQPWVPAANPMTADKVDLGRHLFYDQRLSVNGTKACASCHNQELAFTDGRPTPSGATGAAIPRNAMSLTNVAYYFPLTWENPLLDSLEEQALVPMFVDAPIELGLAPVIGRILNEFRTVVPYTELFPRAFPNAADPFRPEFVTAAIASFERTLISGNSAYDRFAYGGEDAALSPAAKEGMALFFSERCECYHCHVGVNFTSAFRSADTRMVARDYENTGLYNLDSNGAYPANSPGLSAVTADPSDNGKFRVPTLRNVALTAPYMHDGSIATLQDVVEHYASGGRNVVDGPLAGDGRANPHKSPLVRGFAASPDEKEALVAFLRSLTDESFVRDSRFSDPW